MAKQNAVPGPGRNQGHERRLVGVVDHQQLPALVVEGHFIDPLDPARANHLDADRAGGPRAESCGEKYGGCDRETGRSARVHDVSFMESRSGEAPGPPEDRAAICNDLLTPLPAAWSVRTTAFKPGFSFCDSDESLTKYFADRAGYTVGTVIVPQRRGA